MSSEEVSSKVVPTGVLSSDQSLDLFAYFSAVSSSDKPRLGPHIALFNPKPREGLALANRWNENDRPDKRIEVSSDGLTLKGPITNINVNVGVRAKVGYTTGRHYWEIQLESWTATGNGYNTAGVCTKDCPLTATHGYPLAGSIGQAWVIEMYYLHRLSGTGHAQGAYGRSGTQVKVGDVVGFLLDMNAGSLSIYLNGICVGIPYTDLKGKGKLFPVVAMGRLERNVYKTNFKATMPTS